MKRDSKIIYVVLIFTIMLVGLCLTGCDMLDSLINYERTYTLKVKNLSSDEANVDVFNEWVTIPAGDEHIFSLTTTATAYDTIVTASGTYLSNYSKRVSLTEDGIDNLNIEPNLGYFGITNKTGKAITALKYGGQEFVKNAQMEYVGSQIENGEARYFGYYSWSSPDAFITFKFADDLATTYKILSLPQRPTYGHTYTVDLDNSTEKEIFI